MQRFSEKAFQDICALLRQKNCKKTPQPLPKKAAKQNQTTRFLLLVQNCLFTSNRQTNKGCQFSPRKRDWPRPATSGSELCYYTDHNFVSQQSLFLVAPLHLIFLLFNVSTEFHWLPTPNNDTHGSLCPQKIIQKYILILPSFLSQARGLFS